MEVLINNYEIQGLDFHFSNKKTTKKETKKQKK
jgi:hypothetical protein